MLIIINNSMDFNGILAQFNLIKIQDNSDSYDFLFVPNI